MDSLQKSYCRYNSLFQKCFFIQISLFQKCFLVSFSLFQKWQSFSDHIVSEDKFPKMWFFAPFLCRKCDSLRIADKKRPTSSQNVIDNVGENTAVESDRQQRPLPRTSSGESLFLHVTIWRTGAPQNPQNLFGCFSQYPQNVDMVSCQKTRKGVYPLSWKT